MEGHQTLPGAGLLAFWGETGGTGLVQCREEMTLKGTQQQQLPVRVWRRQRQVPPSGVSHEAKVQEA